ncbi:MAG: hypothetical protein EOO15_06830 [Chitinophagaceae bacterium]|nr:MAG: hypothetical protein EOO15_06830 [Chitinophagaceae bacterium]
MSNFIRSIYCYCDHYCETCPFTARCAVFAGSESLTETDPASPGFWEQVMARFAESHTHIPGVEDWEFEVRTPTASEVEEAKQLKKEAEERFREEEVIGLVTIWGEGVMALLEDTAYWRTKAKERAREAAMGICSPQQAMREASQVTDCLHRLRRFTEIADMRIHEAISNEWSLEAVFTSTDGLAKSGLLCLERARTALTDLYGIFDDEDRILPLFAPLGAVERSLARRYPQARAFVRPGFDEVLEPMAS